LILVSRHHQLLEGKEARRACRANSRVVWRPRRNLMRKPGSGQSDHVRGPIPTTTAPPSIRPVSTELPPTTTAARSTTTTAVGSYQLPDEMPDTWSTAVVDVDDRTVTLRYLDGSCYAMQRVEIDDRPRSVALTVIDRIRPEVERRRRAQRAPGAYGCTAIGISASTVVTLPHRLGARVLADGACRLPALARNRDCDEPSARKVQRLRPNTCADASYALRARLNAGGGVVWATAWAEATASCHVDVEVELTVADDAGRAIAIQGSRKQPSRRRPRLDSELGPDCPHLGPARRVPILEWPALPLHHADQGARSRCWRPGFVPVAVSGVPVHRRPDAVTRCIERPGMVADASDRG
jgi:hypothetical protein